MRPVHLLTSIALACLLFSCQRPVDEVYVEPIPPEPPVVPADSTLLLHYVELDPAYPSGEDTLEIMTFRYDESKRIVEQLSYEFADQSSGRRDRIWKYHYSGTSRLPYLVVRRDTQADEPEANSLDSMFLRYSDGQVSSDSTIMKFINRPERSYTSVHHNRIIGDTLYQENIDIPSDISEPESRVTYPNAIKWTNGNLISNASPAGPNSPFILHEYNDHPNPLYTYYIPFPFEYALGDWGIPAYKNLITFAGGGLTRDVDPAKWDFDRYTYTYRKDGYPLTAVVDNNQGDNITVAYVYYSK